MSKNYTFYGWENAGLDTWFFTSSKKVFLPKGTKLKMEVSGESVTDEVNEESTNPKIGDIIATDSGIHIKISKIKQL